MDNPSPVSQQDLENSAATKSLKDFNVFKTTFAQLNTGFATDIQADQIAARKLRRLEIDIDALRQSGVLEANETYIPVRIIDTNISQKLPSRMQYLKSANRLAVFEPKISTPNTPPINTAWVESEFWRVMTYTDWEIPYIQCMDGAEFVGYDWFEVLYTPEEDRPGHTSVNHVGRSNLLFDLSVHTVQDSKLVAKRIPLTLVSLTRIAKEFGFNMNDVLQLREKLTSLAASQNYDYDEAESYNEYTKDCCIYRIFFKEGGVVWTTWYSPDIEHYLTPPKLFYNGVDEKKEELITPPGSFEPIPQVTWTPVEETEYPFYPLRRTLTEDERIARTMGAVTTDFAIQEAACTIFSAVVNQSQLTSQLMASPAGDAFDKSGAPKQLSLKVERGQIWDRKMEFFHPPAPDASLSRVVQDLQTLNAVQNNSIAWAVQNREDSRKTATEITASTQQQSQINSAETLMLSIALRGVFTAAWRIVQSQAIRNLITFCPLEDGNNDIPLVSQPFNIKAAGDTDFVEKQRTIANMQQDWPLIQNTPVAPLFLADYLRLRYPQAANSYIAAFQQGQANNEAINQQKTALLKEAVTDESGNLTPEFAPYAERVLPLIQGNPAEGAMAQAS